MFKSCLFVFILFTCVVSIKEDNEYWLNLGKRDVERALDLEIIQGVAKNVIIFVGDGMGLETITTTRIYANSESGYLAFEHFPHIATLKTYNADKLVPDSCSTATALFCGVKANHKTSGVDPTVTLDDCDASLKSAAQLESIFTWAQKEGKATGFVTTTRVTHATPSALYAHTPNRKWECEAKIPKASQHCKDIARQLIEDEPGRNINVIMGGGRQCLQSNLTDSPEDPLDTYACNSKDGRDLIQKWKDDKAAQGKKSAVVRNNEELGKLQAGINDYVLGVFAKGHLKMDYARDKGPQGMPSLTEMTLKAIETLATNQHGYILMVEGGLIDFGHHRGHARKALDETRAFSEAIEATLKQTNPQETLVIVTSDHSHSMVFTGYPKRQNSVLDVAQKSIIDNVPYTSLLYGTGGPNNYQFTIKNGSVSRDDPSNSNTSDFEYSQQAAVITDEVAHSGTDVLVYAKGPMAHLFHSVHEQTYVAYVVAYAAAIGPFEHRANASTNQNPALFLLFITTVINRFK